MESFIFTCVFIVKAIIVIFSEDLDMGICSSKFELDWITDSVTTEIYYRTEKKENHTHKTKHTLTNTLTHTQALTHTHTHTHTH